MKYNDFKRMLEEFPSIYDAFMLRATEHQNVKNDNRKSKKWDERKIEKVVNNMWETFAQNVYCKVKESGAPSKAVDYKAAWIKHMEEKEFFDTLSDSVSSMEFE